MQVHLPDDTIPESKEIKVCFTNSTISLILQILEEFNNVPCGCFEQASTTNFPLVIALRILLKQKNKNQALIDKMLKNLKKGIKLLLNYETKEGGFEWFGKSPGHSTLSAYGLWQFLEIDMLNLKLFDSSLFDRLRVFFDGVKNEKGGFIIRQGLDELGNPDQNTSDLYVSLMLIKKFPDFATIYKAQMDKVLDYKDKIFMNQESDSYKIALIGLFLIELQQISEAEKILQLLLKRQNE